MVFIKLDHKFVACIFSRLSSSILKVPYLLHEHPVVLLTPANHLRMEREKTQIKNSFESILDEDVPYSIVIKNITAEETRDMFKAFAMRFFVFLYIILYIQFAVSKKAGSNIFLLIQKQPPEVLCEKRCS